jgi:cysteine synthase A
MLEGPSRATGCTILGKAEFLNPGGSVKDRAALGIIRAAEAAGTLKPGGVIVEGTAGNTGIALALIGNALGYKTVIVMPETQSQEKKDMLRALGVELILVPACAYSNPGHYVHTARRIAQERAQEPKGAVFANQFDNNANRQAHQETTAQEIWAQTRGSVDAFICAAGSGGTLGGVSLGLKAKNPAIRIGLADPHGAALYSWYTRGVLHSEGNSTAEGIGQGRVTANLEGVVVDHAYRISDQEGLAQMDALLAQEGLFLGLSSGINVAGAMALARTLGRGKTIVTILCDSGRQYMSKHWNQAWRAEKGL